MNWLLITISLLMTIFTFWGFYTRRNVGNLFRGFAWTSFTVYLYLTDPWLLYAAIALFIIGIFIPRKSAPESMTTESSPVAKRVVDDAVDEDDYDGDDDEEADEGDDPAYSNKNYIPSPPPLPCNCTVREVEVPLTLDAPASYPTADGRTLTMKPGIHPVHVRLQILFNDPGETGKKDFAVDSFTVTHRFADAGGHEWEVELPAGAGVVGTAFEERLERLYHEEDASVILHREETAPATWREALTKQCLLAIQDLMDSRSIYEVQVDGRLLWIQSKYQPAIYHIAWLDDENVFLVRVSNLDDIKRIIHVHGEGSEKLPAIYFTIPPAELLLRTPDWYKDANGEHQEFYEEEPYQIAFHPTGHAANADPGIQLSIT
ncbi:MAG: hypothetical protein ACYC6A_18315 [Armatimonadota bacterium]